MQLKFENGVPLATQIADKIRRDIVSGVYKPGDDFPTVRQLACCFSVNPTTMQKALYLVEAEGLIVTHSTAGRSVTEDVEVIGEAKSVIAEKGVKQLIKSAKSLGLGVDELIEKIKEGWDSNE